MLALTSLLRAGPTRIGSLGNHVQLPRAVRLNVIIAGAICAIPGLAFGAVIGQFIGGITMVVLGAAAGAGIGYVLVSWSPYRGETLIGWATVRAQARGGRIAGACAGVGAEGIDRSDDMAFCPRCHSERPVDPDGRMKEHETFRRFYVGVCQIVDVDEGPVTMYQSAVLLQSPDQAAASRKRRRQ